MRVLRRIGWRFCVGVEAKGYFGGIWLCWREDRVRLDVLASYDQAVHLNVIVLDTCKSFLFTFVYGSPRLREREILWDFLREVLLLFVMNLR